MRLGLCIGLNHNIPESQLIDPVERQHRVRIWWTIYIFDRMWASKMGLPSQVLDDDIHLDMPSSIEPAQLYAEQFSDGEFLKANINLARIVGETTAKVYSRRKYNETFLQRVQKLLKALKSWVDMLSEHLRLNVDEPELNSKQVTSIHLAFNQCVVLATRPTLLHLLKLNETNSSNANSCPTEQEKEIISQPLLTLGEACIHAARHSHSVILTRWISGSLPVFGYFHAHYLFSASLVLAMSSFAPIGNPADLGAFETGHEVLSSMSENGNLAASEFYHNLKQVKQCLDRYRQVNSTATRRTPTANISPEVNSSNTPIGTSAPLATVSTTSTGGPVPGSIPAPMNDLLNGYNQTGLNSGHTHGQNQGQEDPFTRDLAGGFTTAMAFLEPTMQDFLAQSDIDLGLLHPVETFMNDAENLYSGHGFA